MNGTRNAATNLLLMFLVMACQPNSDCPVLAECVSDLYHRTMTLSSWEESDTVLLNDGQFLRLYASADDRLGELVGVIRSDADEGTKLLVALIAQGLSPDRYVEFSQAVLDTVMEGNASERLLAYCVYPGESFGTGLVELDNRLEVQEILDTAGKVATLDILIDRLLAIHDGSYRRYLDHLRDRGDVVPTVAAKLGELRSN